MKATDILIKDIRARVSFLQSVPIKDIPKSKFDELRGMVIALRSISSNSVHYVLYVSPASIEFGYYDDVGAYNLIQ